MCWFVTYYVAFQYHSGVACCLPLQFQFSALSAKVVRLNKVELDEVLAATDVGRSKSRDQILC